MEHRGFQNHEMGNCGSEEGCQTEWQVRVDLAAEEGDWAHREWFRHAWPDFDSLALVLRYASYDIAFTQQNRHGPCWPMPMCHQFVVEGGEGILVGDPRWHSTLRQRGIQRYFDMRKYHGQCVACAEREGQDPAMCPKPEFLFERD